jgi:SurA-like N-terminal domain
VFAISGVPADGETLDRVVASVDYQAITQRDVEIEYRFEQFLNGKQPLENPDVKAREEIRNRLIEQALLADEAGHSVLPAITPTALKGDLAEIQKKFDTPEAFRSALAATGLDLNQVLDRLRARETIMDFADKRLRPQAWVEPTEVEEYYKETFVPAFKQHNPGPAPALADVEGKIREILTEEKINKLLSEWISDMKTNHRVELRSD